ncbi:hypothetical protein [Bacillus sp. REN10]|uniref:hypothetical protein n=1 Tax=Bacillus sp. REN10 TaxID=2782541 RepID=UPI00193C8509|nr:hypothetical protein [Bacillus sp. REN10]
MEAQLLELKYSLKELIQNLLTRIDTICMNIDNVQATESLTFWLEDLSTLTESIMILTENGVVDFGLDLFNEKVGLLLDKIEGKDYLFVGDILQYELKPLLSYWDGCITHG